MFSGVTAETDVNRELKLDAAGVKANHRLSLADAFAIALTNRVDGELVTSDHHELDAAAAAGMCCEY